MSALSAVLVAVLLQVDAGVTVPDENVSPVLDGQPNTAWVTGDHLTGDWGGARDWLAEHGVIIDVVYAAEIFANVAMQTPGPNGAPIGHLDFSLTLDTELLGMWPGGKFYVLGQNNHGTGINDFVGSSTQISNIEAPAYTQLGEFFFEQIIDRVRFRLGKQDANRDFGTPRFGGNFINNNFGMLPTSPLPSYPTNGLGAVLAVEPTWWLGIKGGLFEGSPQIGSYGFDSALVPGAGWFAVGAITAMHHYGARSRNTGTTSVGVYRHERHVEEITDNPIKRSFNEEWGAYFQNDERIYLNPGDLDDPRCFTIITRFSWSQADRNNTNLYAGTSVAYHGIGTRKDDTVGIGFGVFNVEQPLNGAPKPGAEFFIEVFYKWRITKFVSLQPDLQYYRTPGGDGRDALLVGARIKLKL